MPVMWEQHQRRPVHAKLRGMQRQQLQPQTLTHELPQLPSLVPAGNFKTRIEAYEPNITVVYSLPNQPDSNAVVERSNRQWRSIARQLLFNRDARPTDVKVAESSKDARKPWFAKWYGTNPSDGRNGQRLDEINAIMNSIPNTETLRGVSPADKKPM